MEQEMILKKNNAKLIENQNNEIYIATLKERNRIAREIHDSVGHILSRSILQVGALLAICKESTLKPHLETLKVTLDEAMNSIRNSVHDLHDESIDLKTALTTLIEQFTFCPVQFECDLSKQIPKNVKYCFLSIVKEALNNIMKHSNAGKVCVLVKEHPAFYQLLIEDNGTNIAPSLHDRSGIGLSNMKEQVESMNGICNIDTKKGFRIFISVPKK
ncbi:MAG: sensor histidine kinase [Lachnospiraceae bacterium]